MPDTQFVLTVGIGGAEPGLAALDELGLTGKVKIGTFDLSPTILQATADGKMEWGIDAQQYAMGYIPVVMFDLWKKYKIAPIADYPTARASSPRKRRLGHRSGQAGQALILCMAAGRVAGRHGNDCLEDRA